MELDQIKRIRYEEDECKINRLLKEGWVILNTASGRTEDGQVFFCVMLGSTDQE